jgi:hypothetical protein
MASHYSKIENKQRKLQIGRQALSVPGLPDIEDRAHSCHAITMDSGDKLFVCHEGTGTPDGQDGTWSFTGGTGKLKGIKGKGTYICSSSGCDLAGEYQLAK